MVLPFATRARFSQQSRYESGGTCQSQRISLSRCDILSGEYVYGAFPMSDDLLLQGLATRRKLTSQQDIDQAFDDSNPGVQLFEEFATEQYWGGCWSDETMSHRERSWLSLGMAAASGRRHDFAAALQTALKSGITESELQAATRQIVLWCGMAIGSECVRTMREVLECAARASTKSSGKPAQKNPSQPIASAKMTVISAELTPEARKSRQAA